MQQTNLKFKTLQILDLCVYHFTTKVGTLGMIRTCIKRSKSVVDYCPNIINSEKYKQE